MKSHVPSHLIASQTSPPAPDVLFLLVSGEESSLVDLGQMNGRAGYKKEEKGRMNGDAARDDACLFSCFLFTPCDWTTQTHTLYPLTTLLGGQQNRPVTLLLTRRRSGLKTKTGTKMFSKSTTLAWKSAYPTLLFPALLSLVFCGPSPVRTDTNAVPMPDYTPSNLPVASTFFWFSSVEVGVCYQPKGRLTSVKGAIHCSHQGDFDELNNTYALPQTCVALQPIGGPLSTAILTGCSDAGGTFNKIAPAPTNQDGQQGAMAINNQQPTTTDPNAVGGTGGEGGGGIGGFLSKII
ncbi:hypothetical protein BCV70DRAFT_199298 [Testicularia cyperi]|uniref:Uncharacterized protein n=1 Tax=Testicularia cyperi TaxID=1882483 RepID=A0A317XU82_9BASI|nr:hypothetical protein BCV70DRAFT_199298 [Testicularia cyperi]